MTLHDVQRLTNHWTHVPPLRIVVMSVAASLGVKFPDLTPSTALHMTAEEAMRLKQITGGKIEGIAHG